MNKEALKQHYRDHERAYKIAGVILLVSGSAGITYLVMRRSINVRDHLSGQVTGTTTLVDKPNVDISSSSLNHGQPLNNGIKLVREGVRSNM